MNLNVLTRTMKIIRYTTDPASGPLRRTAGQEGFLEFFRYLSFFVTDPPQGRPAMGGGIHRN